MAYEPKDGHGTLYVNDKQGNDTRPDRSGYIVAHRDIRQGEKLNLAGWLKGGDGGRDKFLSLRMSDMRGPADPVVDDPQNEAPPRDDKIPF